MVKRPIFEMIDDIVIAWNQEFQSTFPLETLDLEQKWVASPYLLESSSYALVDDKTLVGAIVLKINPFDMEEGHLAFLFVRKQYRNKGIASQMLEEAIQTMQLMKKRRLIAFGDVDCLFSGIPESPGFYHDFFVNKGFAMSSRHVNLITSSPPNATILPSGFQARVVNTKDDQAAVVAFVKANFSSRWAYEVAQADYEDLFTLVNGSNQVVGFLRMATRKSQKRSNSMNYATLFPALTGIGPLGIETSLRGKGIGTKFVKLAIQYLFMQGATHVMVDWTGLIQFYQGCGFKNIFATFKQYSRPL